MFVVIEIQKNASNQIATLVNSYESRNQAFQKYHSILSAAAVSDLPTHSAVILTDQGFLIAQQSFDNSEQHQEQQPE